MTTFSLKFPSPKSSLMRNRSLRLLWTGELVSNSGSALSTLAGSILIYQLTSSALSVSLLLVAAALPSLLIGLLAGTFVDRYDRKRIMIASDLARALLAFSIPFMISHNVLLLYAAVLLSSAVGQFFNPAHESVLPEIASAAELQEANAWMAISGFGAVTIGFALCGILVAHAPIQLAFYADGLSFLLSAFCIKSIQVQPISSGDHTTLTVVISNLEDGVRYLFHSTPLRGLFLVTLPVILAFGLWNVLLLPFTLHILHGTAFHYGLQEGLTCLAFITGSLGMMKLGHRIKEGYWLLLSFLGMGILGVNYALSSNISLAIGLVMATGLFNAPYSISRRLVIQRNTQRGVRGRVNSAFLVVRDVVYLIGMAAAGLADIWGLRALLLLSALLLVGAGLVTLRLPGLLHSEQEEAWAPASEGGLDSIRS